MAPLMRLWERLPFVGRLLMTATLALVIAGTVMLYTSARRDARDAEADLRQTLETTLHTLPAALAETMVIGDYATAQQTLERYLSHPEVIGLRLADPAGGLVEAVMGESRLHAPPWFSRWMGVERISGTREVVVGGRTYGVLEITLTAHPAINRSWDRLKDHLAIVALAVVLDFLGIWAVLRTGLRPLKTLDAGSQSLARGELTTRLVVQGSPELRHSMTAFNHMADALQQARDSLVKGKERLQVTLASIGDGVITTDAGGRVEFLNGEAARLTGWREEEARGSPLERVMRLLHEESGQGVESPVSRVLKGKEQAGLGTHTLLVGRHGQAFPIAHSAAPIRRGREGELLGVVMVFRDQTGERQQWHALREARLQAEAASRAKSDFLATMSHEIRTPMNAIMGMTELLGETPLSAEQRQYLATCRSSSENLLQIINDVLDIAKIEAGRLEVRQEPFQFHRMVREAVEVIHFRCLQKGLRLITLVGDEVPFWCRGDAARIRQILIHFLGNAIKFTDEGSIATLVSAQPVGMGHHLVQLRVLDTGVGMAEGERERVFEAFHQGGFTRTHKLGGTGLGLTIARRLAEAMGGSVTCSSREGVGSTFTLSVPLRAVGLEEFNGPVAGGVRGTRALLWGSDGEGLAQVNRMLQEMGVRTRGCLTPAELAGQLENQAELPDFLLCCHPAAEGGQMVRAVAALRGSAAGRALPVLCCTHPPGGEMGRELARLGVVCLEEPWDYLHVQEVLEGLRSGRRPPPPPAPGPSPRELRVLAVDDNEDNLLLLRAFLKGTACRLETAVNGSQALDLIFGHVGRYYDLVLMDVQMPVMDGYEATRAIRLWEGERGLEPTPIYALTAHALSEYEQLSREAGCDGHLTKPIRKGRLLGLLQEFAAPGPVGGVDGGRAGGGGEPAGRESA